MKKKKIRGEEKMIPVPVLEFEKEISPQYEIVSSVKVSSKGQFVIPVDIRKAAGIDTENRTLTCTYRNGQIILETQELLSPEELRGFFNKSEDKGNFVLDLHAARDERAEYIMKKEL